MPAFVQVHTQLLACSERLKQGDTAGWASVSMQAYEVSGLCRIDIAARYFCGDTEPPKKTYYIYMSNNDDHMTPYEKTKQSTGQTSSSGQFRPTHGAGSRWEISAILALYVRVISLDSIFLTMFTSSLEHPCRCNKRKLCVLRLS